MAVHTNVLVMLDHSSIEEDPALGRFLRARMNGWMTEQIRLALPTSVDCHAVKESTVFISSVAFLLTGSVSVQLQIESEGNVMYIGASNKVG